MIVKSKFKYEEPNLIYRWHYMAFVFQIYCMDIDIKRVEPPA